MLPSVVSISEEHETMLIVHSGPHSWYVGTMATFGLVTPDPDINRLQLDNIMAMIILYTG